MTDGPDNTAANPPRHPRDAHPRPPYSDRKQQFPGTETEMEPRPDHGISPHVAVAITVRNHVRGGVDPFLNGRVGGLLTSWLSSEISFPAAMRPPK